MSFIKKYLNEARNSANESFLSADGFIDDDLQFTAEGMYFGADAAPAAPVAAPTSQPYIITVTNLSATAVSNFDVLGAFLYLQGQYANSVSTTFTNGSLDVQYANAAVNVSSAIPNVTYQQFLYQSQASPFSVGLTYIEAVTGSGQVTSVLTLNTQDANGNQALKPMIPTIDPYQYQSNIIAMKQAYRIDGYTRITIGTLVPNATVRFHFYPTDNINLARGLAGKPVSRQFANPKVVKDQTVVIKG